MLEFIISWIPDLLREFFNWFLAIAYQFLVSLYEFLNEFLGKSDGGFLNILGMIGIALLTVMIPIAVTLITGFAGEKKSFGALDRNIIFKYIVNADRLLLSIALMYVPILLWDIVPSYPILRIIHLILWGCGVGIMVKVLINVSYWQKGHEFKLRYEYLKNLKNPREMGSSWHSVWEVGDMDGYIEKDFFTIFSSTIDKLLRGDAEKIKTALELVDDFNSFIDKRSLATLVIFEENLSKILEWHFPIWKKTYQPKNEKDNDTWWFYNELSKSLSFTLKKMEERGLKERDFYFFAAFRLHIEKYKERFVEIEEDRKKYYVEDIMFDFFDVLVENIENHENSQDIWEYFPDEWKITSEKIKNRESYISRALSVKFIHWTKRRIWGSSKYDKTLNDVAYNLFPHVSLIMWANIFTFLTNGWEESSKRMKTLIVTSPIFGDIGQTTAGGMGDDEEAEKQMQAEEEETISLALLLFGGEFTQDNLKNYIVELKGLEGIYDSENIMEYSRKDYIDIFEKLLEAHRKRDVEG